MISECLTHIAFDERRLNAGRRVQSSRSFGGICFHSSDFGSFLFFHGIVKYLRLCFSRKMSVENCKTPKQSLEIRKWTDLSQSYSFAPIILLGNICLQFQYHSFVYLSKFHKLCKKLLAHIQCLPLGCEEKCYFTYVINTLFNQYFIFLTIDLFHINHIIKVLQQLL